MSILNVNKINPVGGGSTITIAGIASVTGNVTATGNVAATGTVTGAHHGDGSNLTSIPAGQLTGTIADARISSSSVTQHVTSFDDTSIRHDISMLALNFGDLNNKTVFELANSTIDPMESSASVATATQAVFDATNENWETVSASATNFASGITDFPANSGLSGSVNLSLFTDGSTSNNAFHTDSSGVGAYFVIDLQQQRTITTIRINTRSGNVNSVNWQIQGSNDNSSFTDTGYDFNLSGTTGWQSLSLSSNNTWRYWKFYKTTGNAGGGYHSELEMNGSVANATGSIISNTYTAPSSRSAVSGVLLYRDVAGTATLGTDLKVFFSCNNGTNYTEATSYTPLNTAFKTGVKTATLGKTTCTAGTQIKFKVEWANQANGSKITGCQGIAIQY